MKISDIKPGQRYSILNKTYTKVDSQWMEDKEAHYSVSSEGKVIKCKANILVDLLPIKPSEALELTGYPGDDDSDPRLAWWKEAAALAFELAKKFRQIEPDQHDECDPAEYEDQQFEDWHHTFTHSLVK